MIERGDEGHIVNTASMAGLMTAADPYNVSKHGVVCLTEGLYRDLRELGAGLSASVVCPGLIDTRILDAERNRADTFGDRTDVAGLRPELQEFTAGFEAALVPDTRRTSSPTRCSTGSAATPSTSSPPSPRSSTTSTCGCAGSSSGATRIPADGHRVGAGLRPPADVRVRLPRSLRPDRRAPRVRIDLAARARRLLLVVRVGVPVPARAGVAGVVPGARWLDGRRSSTPCWPVRPWPCTRAPCVSGRPWPSSRSATRCCGPASWPRSTTPATVDSSSASASAGCARSSTRSVCRSTGRGSVTDEYLDGPAAAVDRGQDDVRRAARPPHGRAELPEPGPAAGAADATSVARATARCGGSPGSVTVGSAGT